MKNSSDELPLLNAELYGRDPDHGAYLEVAEQVEGGREKVPTLAREIAINHLTDVAAQAGMSRHPRRSLLARLLRRSDTDRP